MTIEDRVDRPVVEKLQQLGHGVETIAAWGGRGSVGVIGVDPESGARLAAADMRRDGQALVV
jgi:gamma-glutamyltranspeptidase